MGRGRACAVCIHAFPNGVSLFVPGYRATWQLQLHLHLQLRLGLARTRTRTAPAAHSCLLLLHSNVFKALSSMLAGFGRGWACPSPETQFNRREGATNPWCRNHTCHSNNSPSYYNGCFSLMRNVASPASWGRDGIWYLPPTQFIRTPSTLPSPPLSSPLLSPSSPGVRRGPPASRGLEEATSATSLHSCPVLPSPACLAVPAPELWGQETSSLACV